MNWDPITKVAAVAVTAIGVATGLMTWRTAHQTGLHKLTEAELEALLAGAESAADDPPYRRFLEGVRKEKLVSLAFGCAVPLREIGRLMSYYQRGFATTEQIRTAWLHRNKYDQPLSFALKTFDRFWMWGARVYITACILFGLPTFILAIFPPWTAANMTLGIEALCFLGFTLLAFYTHRSLFIANALHKQERLLCEQGRSLTISGSLAR